MKNKIKFLLAVSVAFAFGLMTNNYAISDIPSNYKVAVVDVQKIVASSSQVKVLKDEQTKKNQEMSKFIETAKAALDKEQDASKKKALEEKYNKEFKTKREDIAKNYETKLKAIDKNITSVIESNAKSNGYDLVLVKGVVLSGGIDITDQIAKQVK